MRNPVSTLFVLTSLLLVGPVRAATVTNSADTGPGSLREAIANAASGEIIHFAVNGPITLTSGELVIDKDLTILGPGSDTLSIQRSLAAGTPEFRILHVVDAALSISGLTINNGRSDYGGGMLSEFNAVVLMQDVILSGNSATMAGGGLYNDGVMSLEDSVFSGNSVEAIDISGGYGGGLFNGSIVSWMDRCRFQGNWASAVAGDGGGYGGAINNSGTIFSMDGCVLQENWATGGTGSGDGCGGGLNNDDGTLALTNCTLTGNSATGGAGSGAGFGGGLNNNFGTLGLTNCTLTGNSVTGGTGRGAGFGGGINNNYGTLYVDDSTVRGNVVRGGTGSQGGLAEGGGIANGSGTVKVNRCTLSGNLAVGGAGDNGGSGSGGGAANDDGTLHLYSSTVSGNAANGGAGEVVPGMPYGGGLFNGYGGMVVNHSTIAANVVSGEASNAGGVIFNLDGFVEIKSTIVAANNSTVDVLNEGLFETISYGYNCIGSTAGLFITGPGDQFDLTAATLKMGPLQDNGGPTFTHALLCDSPALDAGDNILAPTTDQRGFARIVGGTIDSGAYEADNSSPNISCPDPIAVSKAPPAGSEVSLTVQVSDVDGDPLNVVWMVDGTASQTNVVPAGGPQTSAQIQYSALLSPGTHLISVSAFDPIGCSATCETTVAVVANQPPVANNQSVATPEDTPVAITLTGSDPDGDSLSFSAVTQPEHGTLSGIAPDLTYTPLLDYFGPDSFTFVVNDGTVDSAVATVSITVTPDATPVNLVPIAENQSVTTPEETPVAITLTGSDIDGDSLSFSVVTQPEHGTLSGIAPDLTYTPAPDYDGPDSFTFLVNDGMADSAVATVSITVTPVNEPPVANNQSVATSEDTPVAVTLTGSDPDGDSLSFTVVTQPQHGTLSGIAPGLTYTPDLDYHGPDSFTFVVNDGNVDSAVATVSITVTPVNDPPVAEDQDVTTLEDTPVAITLAGSDTDGDSLSFRVVTAPGHGTLSGAAPDLTYTPETGYHGPDSFTFVVNDGKVDSAVATVNITVTPVNDAPVADNKSVTTPEDTPVAITLTGSDTDGDSLAFSVETQPEHGTLSGTAPNLTYTPVADYHGPDSFTFLVNDGTVDSAVATVSITVTPVNDPPKADDESVTTPENTPVAITLTGSDLEGDALSFKVVTQPQHGSLSGTAPNLTYSPVLDYSGPDDFTFLVNDGTVDSAVATVSITVTPLPRIHLVTLTENTDNDTPPGVEIVTGTPVTWTYRVTNPGHEPIKELSVVDDQGVDVTFQGGDANADGLLDAGETWTYTANGTAVAGQYANLATANGAGHLSGITVSSSNPDHYFGINPVIPEPHIEIVTLTLGTDNDSPPGPYVEVGNPVNWTYRVTNSGNEPLENVSVTDSVAGVSPVFQTGDTNANGWLDPGETWTYTASGMSILGQYANTGTASGRGTGSQQTVSSSNPDHYFGQGTPCPAGRFTYSKDLVSGDLVIKFTQFPAPNDNSYGINAVGWPNGHTFRDLVNSDHAGFQFRDRSGTIRLDFRIDYLSFTGDTPSGYRSLGPFGGDGSVVTGTLVPKDIHFDTSLARNLNNLGYFVDGVQTAATMTAPNGTDLLIDSPPTLDTLNNYTLRTPHPWVNGWDFQGTYFVTIKKAKLDSLGFDINTWTVEPDLVGLHNSPPKPCPLAGPIQFTQASGGDAISADDAVTGAFTTLSGPTYTENYAGEVGTGTLVLEAPAGFEFDTGGTPPVVSSVKISGSGNKPVKGSVTEVTPTQITYRVTASSSNPSRLTWQNIRVRPVSGTPLANGFLTCKGTATVVGLYTNSNLGTLREVAGAARELAILTQPSATATAGVSFAQQPVIEVVDQFGNRRSSANGVSDHALVTAARSAGSGTLQGITSLAAVDGLATFKGLNHLVATNITIQFASPGLTPVTSDPIAISGAAATRLAFVTQPVGGVAGSVLVTQPAIRAVDSFGNPSSAGLPSNLNVNLTLAAGSGLLLGTTSTDIGTAAGNGFAEFTNLRIDSAGTGKQLRASVTGLASALSTTFTITPGPAAMLVIHSQPPSAATAGTTFAPATVVRIQDGFGNLISDSNTVVTATRKLGTDSLLGTTTVTAINGVATFANLSYAKAETISIEFTCASLPGATSSSVTVNPAAASRLTIQTQPSPTATAGAAFAQQPALRIEDAYGNLRSSDNSTVVTVARTAGSGTLQGTKTVTAVNGIITFANLSHNLANTINLSFTSSGLTGAVSDNIVVSPASFAKLQLLVPGETAAPGTASGKNGLPTARTAGTAFNVTVNAVDAFWNTIPAITDLVEITSSDANAILPANAALVSGTRTFSLTLRTTGTATLTSSDLSTLNIQPSTSAAITVNSGPFAKLQLLVPGETAAPGSATGKTGTPDAQMVGSPFNVTVRAVDAHWNLVSSSHTVGITTTDPNDSHPSSGSMSSGTRTFAVTFRSAGSWTITATDNSDGSKTANTSPPITVNAGAFARLQILLPGETASPGSSTGKTGTPTAQTAGTPFNITVNAVDANWNPVATVTDTVGIGSSDANAELPANVALVAGTQTLSVTLNTAGSRTLTASDLTDTAKTANTSPSVTVNPGPFVKLQVLVPGETTAPGTANGKTGTPTARTAGSSFSVTVRSVDARWNLVSSSHTVGITSSDSSATLPSNGSLSSGIRTTTVTLRTVGSQTVTATDLSDGTKSPNTSPAIPVTAGAANKLTMQTQPSPVATAGVQFVQQPVLRVEDSAGNLVTSDNGRVITVARGSGSGALQGTLTATTVNGVATFANLSHNVANTINLSFTASGLAGATSGNIVVSPATATTLAFTTLPGGTSRTGSPLGSQPVVAIQDAYGNASAIGLPANLNVSLALTSGSGTLLGTTTLDIGTAAGNGTAAFTGLQCSAAGTNKQITATAAGFADAVSPLFLVGGVEPAIGGEAIPSTTAGGAWTTLIGPVYYEAITDDIGSGSITLNAPSGFVFDTSGTAPTVMITRLSGSGSSDNNINNVASGASESISSRTSTQIRFDVDGTTSSGVTCSLTWRNIRVRPVAASPLASGHITKSGSATLAAVNSATSFGWLLEIGPAARLAIQDQPSATATAGVPFAQQPVIRIEDAAGNLLTADNTTVVTATRSSGNGALQGTVSRAAVNGLVTFTDLAHDVATEITITFTSGSLTSATSTAITVSPAAASHLVFAAEPANGIAGGPLATQPVLRTCDPFGNHSTIGLAANLDVTLSLCSGTGPLQGTTTLDIGTSAGNGVASFTDLRIDPVGADKQLTASASGLSDAMSSMFTVDKASQTIAFGPLPNPTYGDAPFALGATASSGLPVSFSILAGPATLSDNLLLVTGAGIVTVRASQPGDANWNAAPNVDQSFAVAPRMVTASITADHKTYDGTTAATIASRLLNGVIGSDEVSLSGGSASFANKDAGTGKTVTASGLALTGAHAANYQLTSTTATTTANITARALAVTATGVNRIYNGITDATVTLSDDRVAGDSLSATGTASFADKLVGTAKPVSVSGITLSGADAANYICNATASTTADITARALTVSATVANKVYDGTTDASVTLSDDRVPGDSLDVSHTSAGFVDTHAGVAKPVSVSGIAVAGPDAANYTFAGTIATTADITPRSLTVTATGVNKVYDGTIGATVTLEDDRLPGDNLTANGTASFADKQVGAAKPISVSGIALSGPDAANYTVNAAANTTADITARNLSVSAAGVNKIYDGTTGAVVLLTDDRVAGDNLSATATASFADDQVGIAKPVSVSSIALSGADAGNYTCNTTASTTADITPRALTVSATAANKIYDGTTDASVSLSDDRVPGDSLEMNYASASFADKNVGSAKSVTVSGLVVSGADAANYTVTANATTTADITARSLNVSATGLNKVYDGTTDATVTLADDRVPGDNLSASGTASFADKQVGTAKPVSVSGIALNGPDAGNYEANTTASATGDILARALTVSATGVNKVYDGSTSATVTLSDDRVGGDQLVTSYASASFADKHVAAAKPVDVTGIALSGADAGNYSFNTSVSATADITARTLTASGITAADKVYDGNTSATLDTQLASLDGVVGGDDVSLNSAGAMVAFADKNVGVGKTVNVSSLSLSGADAGNYSLASLTATADITPALLTVRAEDQSRAAGQPNPTLTATYAGFVAGETLATSGVTGTPALSAPTTDVAGTYPITAALGSLSALNYSFTFEDGQLTVTPTSGTGLVILAQPPATAAAGVAFAPGPQIAITDQYGNVCTGDNTTMVTVVRNAGSGTLQGAVTATAVNGVATFADLSHNLAVTINLRFTASGLTGATSQYIQIGPGPYAALQVLVPGETAVPGSLAGKIGTPTTRTAGSAFTVTVNAVDQFWNRVNTVNHIVNLSSSDAYAGVPADTALVDGTQSFSVTLKAAGTSTLTSSDLTDSLIAPSTSSAMTVNPGAFTKMLLLVPGESPAPGSSTGKAGTPDAQTAGTPFTVTVRAVDDYWNWVSSGNTVAISTSDPNDTHPSSGSMSSGTRNFTVTLKTAGNWTVTAVNTSSSSKTPSTSPSITVNAGAFTRLQLLVPGETAAPGTSSGKTGSPTARTAGTPFDVIVNAVDANWNKVSTVSDTVSITSSDSNAALPPNAALVAGTGTFSVTLRSVGSRTLTASDLSDGSKTASTSPSLTVNTGPFVQLQVLVPGETAAPGTASGKTGTPTAQTAGSSFSVTVRAVDAAWNLVSSSHTVRITSSDSSASLPSNGSLSSGTRTTTVTLRTIGSQTVTATDVSDGTKTPNTSSAIPVSAGAANKLTIQTQPSSTATAGVQFVQQPVLRVEDSAGNLVTSDNGRVITVARGSGTGVLQGTLTATTVNGVATFANLSHNVANTINLSFSASGLAGATSGNIVVSPDTATKLAFTTLPGGTSRTGSPLGSQPVLAAQDAYGNTSTAGLPANLNVSLALTSGSGTLLGTTTLDIGTAAGNGTAAFTGLQCSAAGTNKQITATAAGFSDAVSPLFLVGGVEPATGGEAIPSTTAGGAWTTLMGPVYYEAVTDDIGSGSIILNAPSGFVFDTGGTAPTVKISRLSGSGSSDNNINNVASGASAAISSRTSTQIRFDVSGTTSSGVTCALTWQNIRVRPVAASPLASGHITKSGSATLAAVNSATSFGRLIEVGPAAAASLPATSEDHAVVLAEPARLTGIEALPDGIRITFKGDAGATYELQRAATLRGSDTAWETVGLVTTDEHGQAEFTDANAPAGQGFYRTVAR